MDFDPVPVVVMMLPLEIQLRVALNLPGPRGFIVTNEDWGSVVALLPDALTTTQPLFTIKGERYGSTSDGASSQHQPSPQMVESFMLMSPSTRPSIRLMPNSHTASTKSEKLLSLKTGSKPPMT